ncbi:MAG: hypothetical protein ACLP8S_30240 [Solirubrobacteraceae bacterium]
MPRLAEAALPSFYIAAAREFEGAARREGVVEVCLRSGDRRVQARFAGGALADAVLGLGALAARRDAGGGEMHATIAVWDEHACPAGSVGCPWKVGDVGPGGLVWGSDVDRVVAVHETYSGAVTLVGRAGRGVLHRVPDGAAVPWWERAAPLRPALFWVLGGEGRHLVHAGAVGDDRGGVLLAGASGSGKTTVALAALVHGLGYVADDYVLLHAASEPQAVSLYSTASVSVGLEADEKTVVDVATLMPGSVRESLPVRAVIVPRIRGGRARVRCASPAEALLALAPSTVLQLPFDDGAALGSLAAVVRRVPCFALDVGDDVAELASAVEQVLELAAP